MTMAACSLRARALLAAAVAAASAIAIAGAGCGGAPAGFRAAWPDAQVELRDDADRLQAMDHLWVMAPGGERDRARGRIAAALALRIGEAIDDDQPFVAAGLLDQLTFMWQDDPGAVGRGMAGHAELLLRLRAVFAKSGALEPAVPTLILLSEIEPAERSRHLAELDEVLGFADELAVAENGPDATRGQPIALLEPTALALPMPWVVDRYVALQVERQQAVARAIERQGAQMQIARA